MGAHCCSGLVRATANCGHLCQRGCGRCGWFAPVPRVPAEGTASPSHRTDVDGLPTTVTLADVVIKTSHNSYVSAGQHWSRSSAEGLALALDAGCRCVELDVFALPGRQGSDSEWLPVVAHGQPDPGGNPGADLLTTTGWPLAEALTWLRDHAFATTHDPLFVYLELNLHSSQPSAWAEVARTWHSTWTAADGTTRLWMNRVTGQTPLHQLRDRVVLVTDHLVTTPGHPAYALAPYINLTWNDPDVANVGLLDRLPDAWPAVSIVRTYWHPQFRTICSGNADFLDVPKWLSTAPGLVFPSINCAVHDPMYHAYMAWFAGAHVKRRPETLVDVTL